MDIQRQTEMAHKKVQEVRGSRPSENITEDQFLKDLYLFMKKRDTPIERIPHLGFKQIDLYVMFKTVKDYGGYHQVTAQQLWKQVYNILGGNPRSTSAATCTRRHYEKLLLPYECHIKGLRLNAVQQPRHYHYMGYSSKNEEDGPLPPKRRPVPFPLQNPSEVLSEHHSALFSLSPAYNKFYYPAYPFTPLPQSLLPSPQLPVPPPPPPTYLSCTPPSLNSAECPPLAPNSLDNLKDPLEHLRYLAKQYENSAGFSEPLNLSVKPSIRDITSHPASSFAPPSSNKNPKFLNKVSPLYMSVNTNVKSDAEATADTSVCNSVKCSLSPKSPADSTDAEQNKKEATEGQLSPEVSCINGENGGKRMEIEIPLSVFNNWLQMYGPQATLQGSRQLIIQEENTTKRTIAETMVANMTSEMKQSMLDGESSRHTLSQRCTNEAYPPSLYHCNNRKPAFGILRNAASRDLYLFNDVNKPYNVKSVPAEGWNLTSRSGPALPKQVNVSINSPTAPQDFRGSKPYVTREQVQQQPESEVQTQSPVSVLQLTPEEVMKLKKIISSSA